MLVVKAGNELRLPDPAATSLQRYLGYLEHAGTGRTHDNELRDISHLMLYATPALPAVPVPAAGFLLIGALGGLAALRRRRHV